MSTTIDPIDAIIYECGYECAKIMDKHKGQLSQVKWTGGESNLDTGFSNLDTGFSNFTKPGRLLSQNIRTMQNLHLPAILLTSISS